MLILRATLFLFFSAGLLLFSLPSLRDRRSHGFYRFFAWEASLALILLNAPAWFRRPLSPQQIVSWLLLMGSLLLAIHGFWLLRVVGKPSGNIEATTRLVSVGAYQYIRHPLYTSLLLLAWGAFFKDISLNSILFSLVASLFLYFTALAEEQEMLGKFGDEYAEYMRHTRRFVPFLF
jgi:protein-S-isoprenylcysteine O-methyltransferase Ste14